MKRMETSTPIQRSGTNIPASENTMSNQPTTHKVAQTFSTHQGVQTFLSVRILVFSLSLFGVSKTTTAAEVETVAGNGSAKLGQDNIPGTDSAVSNPFGVEIGPDGALYICEVGTHRVRRFDRETGLITTVAGDGTKGYAGDGAAPNLAQLNEPYEVRFSNGNMFFVEMQNHIVRKVDRNPKVISTVAGSGQPGFGGDGESALAAKLSRPHSIAFDGKGDLYICDIGNHRIRKVNLYTYSIDTFAGTGGRNMDFSQPITLNSPLNGPRALAYKAGQDDHPGYFALALREGNRILELDLKTKVFTPIAGTGAKGFTGHGGDPLKAKLSGPKGIAYGPRGDIYFADTESHTIRVIRREANIIETLVGDGKPGDGPDGDPLKCRLNRPHGICVDQEGRVYIGDSNNNKVRVYVP